MNRHVLYFVKRTLVSMATTAIYMAVDQAQDNIMYQKRRPRSRRISPVSYVTPTKHTGHYMREQFTRK